MIKNNKGVTLVSLTITIIVLLILAVVSMKSIIGDNGSISEAKETKKSAEQLSAEVELREAIEDAKLAGEGKIELSDATKANYIGKFISKIEGATYSNGKVELSGNIYTISKNGTITFGDISQIKNLKEVQGTVISTTENVDVQDEYGNIIKVPAGFKITTDASTVPEGIVIEDVSAGDSNSKGNQFVWVPVGDVYTTADAATKESTKKTINLKRYVFNVSTSVGDGTTTDGSINESLSKTGASDQLVVKAGASSYYTDETAETFQTSANANKGYYIGRYEAGDSSATSARSSATDGTAVCKANQQVYNYISRSDSITKAKNMYTEKTFISELINSFAWDTAIVYIQTFGKTTYQQQYSKQERLQKSTLALTGKAKDGSNNNDVQQNIYDMAGNCSEWTTETFSNSSYPCVNRGGFYGVSNFCTSSRSSNSGSAYIYGCFRPILYL